MARAPHSSGDATNSVWPAGYRLVDQHRWERSSAVPWVAHTHIEHHGMYAHLDRTVDALAARLRPADLVLDYEGGTGILVDRMRLRQPGMRVGVLVVDRSARDLREAMDKYRDDPLVALRLRRFLASEARLESIDEVIGDALLQRGVDAIVCSHASFLYPDVVDTVSSLGWLLRPGGPFFINSGSIGNPRAHGDEWLLDETVWDIDRRVQAIVREDDRYRHHRAGLDDAERMREYADRRGEVFTHPRPLQFYLDALRAGGLVVEDVREERLRTPVSHWFSFLSSHHETVLGWVGGSEAIDGVSPAAQAVADRLDLMRRAIDEMFLGLDAFTVLWTFITCRKPEE